MEKISRAIGKFFAMCAVLLATASVTHATAYTYATDIRWDNGLNATPSTASGTRYNDDNALGAQNGSFLSLGLGGLAVFDFGKEFDATAVFFETTNGSRAGYPEFANIYVAGASYAPQFAALNPANGQALIPSIPSNFVLVQNISNLTESTVVDLSQLDGPFRYLLIQDASPLGRGLDGFDIDAVGVAPVPEPGTVMLLGLGLVGVAIVNKRRRNSKE